MALGPGKENRKLDIRQQVFFSCMKLKSCLISYYSGESLSGSRKRRLDMDESPDSAERLQSCSL